MTDDNLIEAWALIAPRAEIADPDGASLEGGDRRRALLAALTDRFAWILAHDVGRLPWWLYRLDVRESAVDAAFAGSDAGGLARALAELVLERTLQKVASRRRWDAELGGDRDFDD